MEEFIEMKRQGRSLRAISKLTGYDRKTVRKYILKSEAVPHYGPRDKQASKLDAHKEYLQDRLKAGVWNAQESSIPTALDVFVLAQEPAAGQQRTKL